MNEVGIGRFPNQSGDERTIGSVGGVIGEPLAAEITYCLPEDFEREVRCVDQERLNQKLRGIEGRRKLRQSLLFAGEPRALLLQKPVGFPADLSCEVQGTGRFKVRTGRGQFTQPLQNGC